MKARAALAAWTVAIACLSFSEAANPVTVSVYYESLCPDSQRFVVTQLYPVWQDLKDVMTLDVNSYGKSKDSPAGDGYTFECQHGPSECEGNMMLTCAKRYSSEEQYMSFANCIMADLVGTAAGPKCAEESGVDYTRVEDCFNSVEGQQLQHEVGVKQEKLDPPLDYVPWILINEVFTEAQLDAAQEDLRKVVCDAYEGVKPEKCSV
ncbi:gamma-interferon-inducible lysosomal thiol reductase-like isoform X2 [Penaeus japonicus]|uniref:gamma-interferon-inducible lysosomal thiol reductase-like isoform X1 n=1 Tax=Penaeus japonicus TaxID=27405 RepID=UPI001C715C6A|nr:gamma-interferon-inducible lysosomal thiol reductase-like isoform X1 [Penaeus japonicus]XP_042892801.1 gamma-interferon-inducible lysosomal thiol reductase-like isoform X2 [Penaeus japonicus]